MKRLLLIPVFALLAVGCGGSEKVTPAVGDGAAVADLTVMVWADASTSQPTTRKITCGDANGDPICAALATASSDSFAPTAANVSCTEIYGGPGKATLVGTFRGRPLDATFTRSNGCELQRWARIVELGLVAPNVGGVTAP